MDSDRLREVVAAIPHGRWMSYGDVALAAGGGERHARALNRRFTREETPGAHRVLKADGSVMRNTRFSDDEIVSRNSLVFPSPASRESTGIAAVPRSVPL